MRCETTSENVAKIVEPSGAELLMKFGSSFMPMSCRNEVSM